MKGVLVVMVMMAIVAALRKLCGLVQLMEYDPLIYTKLTSANGNDGSYIRKSKVACG